MKKADEKLDPYTRGALKTQAAEFREDPANYMILTGDSTDAERNWESGDFLRQPSGKEVKKYLQDKRNAAQGASPSTSTTEAETTNAMADAAEVDADDRKEEPEDTEDLAEGEDVESNEGVQNAGQTSTTGPRNKKHTQAN